MQWTPYAFVRFAFYLIAGIITAKYLPVTISPLLALLIICVLTALLVLLAFLRRRYLHKVNPGWPGLAAVYLLGYFSVPFRSESIHPQHLIHHTCDIEYYTAVVASYPDKGANTWKQVAEVQSIRAEKGWHDASGKVLLYFDLDGHNEPFPYGTVLLIKGEPNPVRAPLNPEEFNYKRFLSLQHIHRQQYIRAGEAFRIGDDPPSRLMDFSIAARSRAEEIYNRFIPGRQERVVTSALVLGDKDGLDDNLYNAFSASGTMHVLAVSGLHVGIIYSMIMVVLGPIKKMRGGTVCFALLSVTFLWGYAIITGLSPSVLRATMMFSFVTIAGPWGRRSNIYNTFGVSAFVLLLYEPNLIFSVSFQLSYAAVFGIVYFYPKLVQVWQPSSRVARKIWEMSCVSVAAQLSTFPIAIFYFGQFPVYFLLANLLAIPLSFAILVVGILLLMASVWTPVAAAVGYVVYCLVLALTKTVVATASLPFGVIDGIYLSPLQCWMLIALVFTAIILIEFRKFQAICAGALFSLVFTLDQWTRDPADSENQRMVVYQVRGHYAFEFTHGERSYFLADSSLTADPGKIAYHIDGYRAASGIRTVSNGTGNPFIRDLDGARLICWKEYTIIHIFGREFQWPEHLTVDCAIVSNNAVTKLDDAAVGLTLSQLIVDGSNSDYVTGKLKAEATEHAVAFHSTGRSGAYIKEI